MFHTYEAWIAAHRPQIEEAVTVGESVVRFGEAFIGNALALRHDPVALEAFLTRAREEMPNIADAVRARTVAENEEDHGHAGQGPATRPAA